MLTIAAVCLFGTSSAQAILLPGTLGFTDGNGTALVDQYRGRAGDGWLEGWVPSGTIIASVVDTNPIGAGGNYLSLEDIYGGRGVTRQFLAPTTYPYRLMLDLRVDDIPTSGSRTINLSTGSVRSVNTNNTNYVQANATQGGNWRFIGDGTTNTSDIPLVLGTTYHFDFLVDPVAKSFTATVSNAINTYTSPAILFRNQNEPVNNPFFELGAQGGSSDLPYAFSLDNIRFAPEPSSHFTDGGSGSDWATADNWDNGVPGAQTFAHIGAGNAATLSATGAEAFQVIIGHTGGTLPGNGTLNQTGGDLTVANGLLIGVNTTGSSSISGEYTATGGSTLTVGQQATGRANLYLGYNSAGTSYDATGTLDLSGAAQFDAYLNNLVLGEVTSSVSTGRGAGTLKLAATNNIDATQIVISNSSMHAAHQLWSAVELGNVNNIQTDLLVVGGRRGRATVTFAASGGTLNLTGSSGAAADLRVAYTDLNTGSLGNATMDLSGGTFNATLNDVVVAHHLSKGGTDTGTLTFDAGTVNAQSLTVGWARSHSTEGKGIAVGTVNMGGGSFTTTSAVLGTGEGTATGTLNLGGGTFTSASLVLGHGLVHAGAGDGTGTLNVSGGTAQINGSATLGTGTAASSGTINLTDGQMNVTGDVTGGVGSSTLNVHGGTMNVGGDLTVNTLRVGQDGRTATLSVGGDAVANDSGSLRVGYRSSTTINPAEVTDGTLDLSGADSVTLNASNIDIGVLTVNHNTTTKGTLKLPAESSASISAATIMIGNSAAGYTPTVHGIVELGFENTVYADTIYVGRIKAQGEMGIVSGGTLDLAGLSGDKVDLYVGYNYSDTGTDVAQGTVDLVGGEFNAAIGQLVVGYHRYPWSLPNYGSGTGTLSFNAGSVAADAVTLGAGESHTSSQYGFREGRGVGTLNMGGGTFETGSITLAEGSSRAEGTLNLSGGTLAAESISGGAGTATFNWTGGRLSVDSFGFDLLQTSTTGPSTLAPGNSPGMTTIYGDYTMNTGTLEIEIAGPEEHDFVMVHGDASLTGDLNVLLLDDYFPDLGTHFDVLQTTGALDIEGLTLTGDLPSLTFGWWDMGSVPSGDGFLLRLSAVPEPTSALLALLALVGLLGYIRPRRCAR